MPGFVSEDRHEESRSAAGAPPDGMFRARSSDSCHDNYRYLLPSLSPDRDGLLTFNSPKILTRLEPDAFPFGNWNRGPGLDIPPGSALPGPRLEHAKASDLDAIPVE